MKRSSRIIVGSPHRVIALLALLTVLVIPMSLVEGQVPEPKAAEFIDGLIAAPRNFPDIAIYYLEKINKDNTIPAALKEVYDMKMGDLHQANAAIQPSFEKQLEEIEVAYGCYQKFIKEKPTHPEIRNCANSFCTLMWKRGVLYRDMADKMDKKPAEERENYRKISRESFLATRAEFLANAKRAADVIRKLMDEKVKPDNEELHSGKMDFLFAKLTAADAFFEIAMTYPKDSKEYKDNLTNASGEYNELFKKYGKGDNPYYGGLRARLREGRIKMLLGNYEDTPADKGSIGIFKETMTLGYDPGFRKLTEEALKYIMEQAAIQKKPERLAEAKALFDEWFNKEMNPGDRNNPWEMDIQLSGCDMLMAGLEAGTDEQKASKEFRQVKKDVNAMLSYMLQREYKKEEVIARFAKMGINKDDNTPPKEMRYDQLLMELQTKWEMYNAAREKAAAAAQDANLSNEDKAKLNEELVKAGEEALFYYELLEAKRPDKLAEDNIEMNKHNAHRYRAAGTYFTLGNPYRAVMLGEFLARNYPTFQYSKDAATMTTAICRNLFAENRKAMKAAGKSDEEINKSLVFEAEHLLDMAKVFNTRFKADNVEENDKNWNYVCDTFVEIDDIDKAKVAMGLISEGSERRANCEIRIGNAYWNQYLRSIRADLSKRPDQKVIDQYKNEAQSILQNGLNRMKAALAPGEEPTLNIVTAAYTLAYLQLNSGDPAGALVLLNDPQTGPLTLVKKNSEVTKKSEIDVKTLRLALPALVSSQQLDKAEEVMDLLEKLVSQHSDEAVETGGKKMTKEEELTNIYIQLGLEIEESLEILTRENKLEEMAAMAKGFEVFLNRIASRTQGNTFGSLVWVAETYKSLGTSLALNKQTLPPEAKAYFGKAAEMYKIIYDRVINEKGFVSEKADLTAQVMMNRRAKCLLANGDYEEAINIMGKEILSKVPNNIDVQIDAATTYTRWADIEADPQKKAKLFRAAMVGSSEFKTVDQPKKHQNGVNAVWGWAGLAKKMSDQMNKSKSKSSSLSDRFAPTYFEARFQLASIYEKQSEALEEPEKTNTLQKGEKILVDTHRFHPTLGGEEFFGKYNSLLIRIRRDMGVKNAKGFSELDTARGFIARREYDTAIERMLTALKQETVSNNQIDSIQAEMAGYYAKWADYVEEDRQKVQLYNIALKGNPKEMNFNGNKQLVIGWEKILAGYLDKDNKLADQANLLPYLEARLAIARINQSMANMRMQIATEQETAIAEGLKSGEMTQDAADKRTARVKSMKDEAIEMLTTIKTDLVADFQDFAQMNLAEPQLGTPDMLSNYQALMKEIQGTLGEEQIAFDDPAELARQAAAIEAAEKAAEERSTKKEMDPTTIYAVIGGGAGVAFLLALFFLWPRKKKSIVPRTEVRMSEDGKIEAPELAQAGNKIDFGIPGAASAPESDSGKPIDLGIPGFGNGPAAGAPQETFSFEVKAPKKPQ